MERSDFKERGGNLILLKRFKFLRKRRKLYIGHNKKYEGGEYLFLGGKPLKRANLWGRGKRGSDLVKSEKLGFCKLLLFNSLRNGVFWNIKI